MSVCRFDCFFLSFYYSELLLFRYLSLFHIHDLAVQVQTYYRLQRVYFSFSWKTRNKGDIDLPFHGRNQA